MVLLKRVVGGIGILEDGIDISLSEKRAESHFIFFSDKYFQESIGFLDTGDLFEDEEVSTPSPQQWVESLSGRLKELAKEKESFYFL